MVTPVLVTQRMLAVQYDGSNGADIAAWLDGPLISEVDGVAVFHPAGSFQRTITTGDWVAARPAGPGMSPAQFNGVLSPDEYATTYIEIAPVP